MGARDAILARVRAAAGHRIAHPGPHPAPALPAQLAVFARAHGAAGGETEGPLALEGLRAAVAERAGRAGGRVVAEAAAARVLGAGPFESAAPDAAPGSFADVALAVAAAELGVAECGAVAVLGRDAPHRSLLFLAEELILLLPAARIVADLHSAFRALPEGALDAQHLTWIAGPSKSADIEQALVKGAHGPRAVTVLVYA